MKKAQQHSKLGFSLIEVILATSIFALLSLTLAGGYLYGQEGNVTAGARARAGFLAEEGLEAVRNMRDEGSTGSFSTLIAGTYGLATSSGQWVFSGSSDVAGVFTRAVTISDIDAYRKEVTAVVTWQQNAQRQGTVTLRTRLTDWMREVIVIGDWANATTTGSADITGIQNALKVATQDDYAYVVLQGGSPDFVIFDISDPDAPTQVGSLTLSGGPRDVEVSGDYAFLAATDNSEELKIIDVSNPSAPVKVGAYDAQGGANGNAVGVQGDTVYLARSSSNRDEFLAINVTNKSSPSLLGSIDLGATANEVKVVGNYAYVASDSNSQELQVINISSPAAPALVGAFNAPSNNNGETLAAFGSTVVLGIAASGDVYVLSVSTPTSPSQVGYYDGGDDIRDMALGNGNQYVFLATDSNAAEFQVINISTPSTPTLVGSVDLTGNSDLNGVSYHADFDRAYVVGDSNSEELIVLAPG